MRDQHAEASVTRSGFRKGLNEFVTGMALYAITPKADDMRRFKHVRLGKKTVNTLVGTAFMSLVSASCLVAFVTGDIRLASFFAAPALVAFGAILAKAGGR